MHLFFGVNKVQLHTPKAGMFCPSHPGLDPDFSKEGQITFCFSLPKKKKVFIVAKDHDIDLREEEKHSFIKSKLSSLIHKEGDFTWNNCKVSQLSYFTELGDREVSKSSFSLRSTDHRVV